MTKTKEDIAHKIYKVVGLPKNEIVIIAHSIFDIKSELLVRIVTH
jgi:hypothetical protein